MAIPLLRFSRDKDTTHFTPFKWWFVNGVVIFFLSLLPGRCILYAAARRAHRAHRGSVKKALLAVGSVVFASMSITSHHTLTSYSTYARMCSLCLCFFCMCGLCVRVYVQNNRSIVANTHPFLCIRRDRLTTFPPRRFSHAKFSFLLFFNFSYSMCHHLNFNARVFLTKAKWYVYSNCRMTCATTYTRCPCTKNLCRTTSACSAKSASRTAARHEPLASVIIILL